MGLGSGSGLERVLARLRLRPGRGERALLAVRRAALRALRQVELLAEGGGRPLRLAHLGVGLGIGLGLG